WVRLWTPADTHVAPNASLPVTMTVDARGLVAGTYFAKLRAVNEPIRQFQNSDFVLTLTVQGQPHVAASPSPLSIDSGSAGWHKTRRLTVTNLGATSLTVSSVTSGDPTFVVSGQTLPVSIGSDQSKVFNVTFNPTTAGDVSSQITIATNDPNTPSLVVPVVGHALAPPVIAVTPSSVNSVGLNDHVSTSQTVQVSNSGGNTYHFTLGTPSPHAFGD